jgi:hypothetical protein
MLSCTLLIEKALEQLPPEQWAEIRRWMDSRVGQDRGAALGRTFPVVAATGRAITQQEIDDALNAD